MQIGSLIRRSARQYGDAPCLTEGNRTISFREFDQATDRLGNALLDLGLRPGDRVGVAMPNTIQCLIAYFALAKSGLVRVSINTRETVHDLNFKLDRAGARAVIHNGINGLKAEFSVNRQQLTDMIENGRTTPCDVDRALDDVFRLAFTGGTTGKPKAVTLSTRGELVETNCIMSELLPDVRQGDIFLHGAPIAHASGALFLPTFLRGGHSVVMPKFDTTEFLQLAEETGATLTFLVPTMIAMILEHPDLASFKTKFTRITYAASTISPSVLARAEAHFGRVFAQTYGQAESPMVITCLQPEDHDRIGSCGRPYAVVDVMVFDENDSPLPPGEIGEIVCRGPQVMDRYWENPDATAEAFRNGWLHTGDLGKMDDDGFFYIIERKNDLLVSGGFNIYPREIEDVLMGYDGIVEAALIGLPDERWGHRLHAVVSGQPTLDAEQIMTFARENLADFKRPKSIEIWPELPKSAAGKILRRAVRDRVLNATPTT
ncbi:AMP-binding protein [Thalassovita taeanensis]|uniref:Acyl-CoA synthetase (AMP-forming)/AMP-acid ligase II n=1 Tax=Thalassovita taeanensis TaxID=657014 RepID=A0A1H9BVV5_9RHOB|nr:AMP-binding protein [Thalassovita taeanensis]SEP93004.1 Acyl-CoA synthetase (AMP-forming)/AMP-acid ligase II [Thalassovita taeanensis]